MPEKSRLKRLFHKQHSKRAKALFKSASQHLYHIHWYQSISSLSIEMQLTEEKNIFFFQSFAAFLKSRLSFKYFVKNDDPHRF